MVHITPETVESFKQLFKKEYGVEYSDKEAWEATHNLLGFFDLLLKMDRKQQKMKGEKQGGVK
jgi:protein-tyrosine-phosphatase